MYVITVNALLSSIATSLYLSLRRLVGEECLVCVTHALTITTLSLFFLLPSPSTQWFFPEAKESRLPPFLIAPWSKTRPIDLLLFYFFFLTLTSASPLPFSLSLLVFLQRHYVCCVCFGFLPHFFWLERPSRWRLASPSGSFSELITENGLFSFQVSSFFLFYRQYTWLPNWG